MRNTGIILEADRISRRRRKARPVVYSGIYHKNGKYFEKGRYLPSRDIFTVIDQEGHYIISKRTGQKYMVRHIEERS